MNPQPLSPVDRVAVLRDLPLWQVNGTELVRVDCGESFAMVIDWVVAVARVADSMNHHPDIEVRYRTVTWRLTTRDVGSITELDVQLARAIDEIVGG